MTVLTLDEIKEHLNITDSTYDDELTGFIEAAEAIIAERVGPLEETTFTSTVDSSDGRLILPAKPVISITSITLISPARGSALGFSYGATDLHLNRQSGEVTTSTGYGLVAGRYEVVYEAGLTVLPASLRLAVKEMVRHLWKSQRGGSQRPGSTDQAAAPGYLIPYHVQGLLQPHQKFRFGFI
jgi:uncharacterized phiE125 gp8 family phage protein